MLLLSNLWALKHLKKKNQENLNFLGGGGGGGLMNPRIHQTPLPSPLDHGIYKNLHTALWASVYLFMKIFWRMLEGGQQHLG